MDPLLPSRFNWSPFWIALFWGVVGSAAARGEAESAEEGAKESEPARQLVFVEQWTDGSGVGKAERLQSPFDVKVSPDGRHVYVASNADDAVAIFARDEEEGTLSYSDDADEMDLGAAVLDGVFSLALSPDGKFLYAASMFADTLTAFSRSSDSGALSYLGASVDGEAGVDGLEGARSVVISPDGKNVYVAAYDESKLSVFSRNSASGAASFLGVYEEGDQGVEELTNPHAIAVAPDGRHVYVALSRNELVVFERDDTNGLLSYRSRLSYLQGISEGGTARSIAISPDGGFVYVGSWNGDALTVFERDADTGDLAHVEDYRDGVGDTVRLDGPYDLGISPDGKFIYVAVFGSDAVTVFRRDSETGALSFFQSVFAESEDEWAMDGPLSIAVSPDGEHVYLGGGKSGHSLTAFRREVLPDPPVFVVQPVARAIEEGESVAFHALAQGENVSYQWYRNGVAIEGENLPVLTIAAASPFDHEAAFRVVASNPGGSEKSDSVALTVLPPVVIASPVDLTALDISSRSARLAWSDESDNETNFEIQRRVSGGAFAPVATVLANATEYLDETLAASTSYRYRVAAKRNDTYSAWSNEAVIESYDDVPQAPVNLRMIDKSYNRVLLGWNDRSAVENGFQVYRRRAAAGSSWELLATTGLNVDRFEDRAVIPSATYAYRVRAFNESGESEYANAVVAITDSIPVTSIAPTFRSIPKDDKGGFTISVESTKVWEALSSVDWLVVTSPADGQGAGNESVVYRALLNEAQEPRTGTVTVGGLTHMVTQDGSPPFLRLSPAVTELGPAEATAEIAVESNMTWAVSEEIEWLRVAGGANGDGYGTLVIQVDENATLESRSGVVMINDREHVVHQEGMESILKLDSDGASVPSIGGSGAVAITATVPWTASVAAGWLRLTDATSGEGDGVILFEVDENLEEQSRSANILVNDIAFMVTQDAFEIVVSDIAPPQFLSADVTNGLGVKLVWQDNSDTESGFLIRKAIAGTSDFSDVTVVAADVTEYFDRDATRGRAMEYRIAALDDIGRSVEDAIVTELLPMSNFAAVATQVALGGGRALSCADFKLEGSGRLNMTGQGIGPGLEVLSIGGPAGASTVTIGQADGGVTRMDGGIEIDWEERFGGSAMWRDHQVSAPALRFGVSTEDVASEAYSRGVAARGWVGPDAFILAGFEIEGTVGLPVLIRGFGAGASKQGATEGLSDPLVELYQVDVEGGWTLLAQNDNWGSWSGEAPIALEDAERKSGSASLSPGSRDSLILTELAEGRYAVVLKAADRGEGVALLEVYDVR